jgi:hypothetical protein
MRTVVDVTVFPACIVGVTEFSFLSGEVGDTTLSGRNIILCKVFLYTFCCLAYIVIIVSKKYVSPVLVVLGFL